MIYDVEVRWKPKTKDEWLSTYFMVLADDQDDAYIIAEEKFMENMSNIILDIDKYTIHDILPVVDEIR